MSSVCVVCSVLSQSKCPCGEVFCSRTCQREAFSDHKLDCLVQGFGTSGHYAFWFTQMADTAISQQLKSELKRCHGGFLAAINVLKEDANANVPGKTIRDLWTKFTTTLEKVPVELVTSLQEHCKKPTLQNAKDMLSAVEGLVTRRDEKKTTDNCMVCYEPFNEGRPKAQMTCPCTKDCCFNCFCIHVVRTATPCTCGEECGNFMVKCPTCRVDIKLSANVLVMSQQRVVRNNLW